MHGESSVVQMQSILKSKPEILTCHLIKFDQIDRKSFSVRHAVVHVCHLGKYAALPVIATIFTINLMTNNHNQIELLHEHV